MGAPGASAGRGPGSPSCLSREGRASGEPWRVGGGAGLSLGLSFSISPSYKALPSVSETFPTLRSMMEVLNTDPSPRCLKQL